MEKQFLFFVVIIWTTWFLFPTLLARTRMTTMIPHPHPCHGGDEDGGDEVVDVDLVVVVAGRIRPE